MPALHRSLALALFLTSGASAVQEASEPMAPFARLVGGEWRMTRDGEAIQFDTWTWGPGRRSVVNVTHGIATDDVPWRVLDVYYWHPGLEQVRVLGLHPDIPTIGRGVIEGAMAFEEEAAAGRFDLYQGSAPRPRTMAARWVFDGAERYRETLLEADGPDAAFSELAAWDYVRGETLTPARPLDASHLELSANLRALAPLLGSWTASDDAGWSATLEWLPLVEVVRLRVRSVADGALRLEAFLYEHPTRKELRCLALTAEGGVHEGRLQVPDDGSLRLRFASHDDAGAATHDVRIEPQAEDGAWRASAWRIGSEGRTSVLDALLARDAGR